MFLRAISCAMTSSADSFVLSSLKVNAMREPISIDRPPSFSWSIDADGKRGVLQEGYELQVNRLDDGALVWASGEVKSNRSQFVTWPKGGPQLVSDADYLWKVRAYPGPSEWSKSTFSTGLLHKSDWEKSEWVQSTNETPFASQMRKVFTIQPGRVVRARAFVALPGFGDVWINGQKVDGRAGTRSLSQYDVRALYHVYDVQNYLRPGEANSIAVSVAVGWFGHPPLSKPYGPPTLRLLLHIESIVNGSDLQLKTVGTDTTWLETPGPVTFEEIYNGTTYDARLETPGWTSPDYDRSTANWTAVLSGAAQPGFKLNSTVLSAATFPAVEVMQARPATSLRMPAPGVYVYDFGQNLPGWCKLRISGRRGLQVQLRHAEVLQHPPYGPFDGSIFVANLRTARATDVYILKGDPNGETVEFSMSQHGFRYVELTFPGSPNQPPPSLNTLEVAYARSAVAQSGALTMSNPLLQQVHHNILMGQASNLMMVPTDCDQRDERYGWLGDAAVTADEAAQNFDMGAFYHNWLQMLDDVSEFGALPCFVPSAAGSRSPHPNGSCDATWTSAFPSVAYALYKWSGDVTAPQMHWPALTRFIDNEFAHTANGSQIDKIFATWGDWQPAPASPSNPDFSPEPRVDKEFVGGFSFVNDVGHMAEMAKAIDGEEGRADVDKYTRMYATTKAAFHTKWFDAKTSWYADGGQTAQVLALTLDGRPPFMMTAAQKAAVVARLVLNIDEMHGNHSTSGIVGFRHVMDVLADHGFGDVAFAMMTQTSYPSFGYQILNKYEPATTVWELWDSDISSLQTRMDSRNHIMFGGPGSWLHTYVGGITNAPGSIGYEHVWFAPPATLITHALAHADSGTQTQLRTDPQAQLAASASEPLRWASAAKDGGRGNCALFWSVATAPPNQTCVAEAEGSNVAVNCSGVGISEVVFADFGTPSGDCNTGLGKGNCTTANLTKIVSRVCTGQDSCAVECTDRVASSQFEGCNISATSPSGERHWHFEPLLDPCHSTRKRVGLQVRCRRASLSIRSSTPGNSIATTAVPLLGADPQAVTVTENGTTLWADGKFVPSVAGVQQAAVLDGAILVSHGSGEYDFRLDFW